LEFLLSQGIDGSVFKRQGCIRVLSDYMGANSISRSK
jgi:hypothetical protein